jgi:ABC-type enterochelin transport system permease subunit
MSALAFALAFSAFVALCLSMEKHQMDLHGANRADALAMQRLRWTGWVLTVAAFVVAIMARGWTIGPLWWLGTMTASGVAITYGLLPYRPRWIKPAALALPVVALVSMLLTSLG